MSDIRDTQINFQPNWDNLKVMNKSRDDFHHLCFKFIEGKELNDADKTLLKQLMPELAIDNKFEEKVEELRNYLKIAGTVNDTDIAEFDQKPFKRVGDEDNIALADKQKNFIKELEAFNTRMEKVFGDTYRDSKAKEKIDAVIKRIDADNVDGRNQISAVDARDRAKELQDEFSKYKPGENHSSKVFKGFSLDQAHLLMRGVTRNFTPLDEKRINNVDEITIQEGLNAELTIVEGDPNEWLEVIEQASLDSPALKKNISGYLKRRLYSLKALDTDADFSAMKEFLQLKNKNVDDSTVKKYIEDFNKTVEKLKPANEKLTSSDIDNMNLPEDFANVVKAHNAEAPEIEGNALTFIRAYQLLDRDGRYYSTNKDILELEKLYTNVNTYITLPEDNKKKKEFLKVYVENILDEKQKKSIESDDKHHSKVNPDILYSEFKDVVYFLESYVNSKFKSYQERKAIQNDLLRFAQGGEASQELNKAFGDGEDGEDGAELLKALKYLGAADGRGYGKPGATVGILKTIFQLQYVDENGKKRYPINFNGMVQSSTNFKDLALKLQKAIALSKVGDTDNQVVAELRPSNTDGVEYVLKPLDGLEVKETTDKEGNVRRDFDFDLFDDLNFVPSEFNVKYSDTPEAIGKEIERITNKSENGESKLLKLLSYVLIEDQIEAYDKDGKPTTALYEAVGNAIKIGLDKEDKELQTLPNNGAGLAILLKDGIKKIDREYLDYSSLDLKEDFKTIKDRRQSLIDFSKKQGLELFNKDEVVSFFHVKEYEEMCKDFAMNFSFMKPMMEKERAFYSVPKALKVNYEYGKPDAEDQVINQVADPATQTVFSPVFREYDQTMAFLMNENMKFIQSLFNYGNEFNPLSTDSTDIMNPFSQDPFSMAMSPYQSMYPSYQSMESNQMGNGLGYNQFI